MRVLTLGNMYPPHHQGGYERAWAAVVTALRAAGHEVRVLTTTHREPGVPDPSDGEPGVRRELPWYWHDHDFPARGLRATVALERAAHAVLDDELRTHRPDVVACFSMGGLSLSLLAVVRDAGLPTAAVVHDEWLAYAPRVDGWTRRTAGLPAPLRALATRLTGVPAGPPALDHVSRWSANSAYVADRARQAGATLPRDRTTIDHPGIDPEAFAPAEPAAGWGGRLLVVGRLVPEKGVEHAVRALALLPDDHRLVVVGAGDDAHVAQLRTLARDLGVEARVDLRGALAGADLRAAYADCDAVVFPVTWAEPFGLVPLEAMNVGRPVVATATGGAQEYLRDGVNALVVPTADGAAIATATARLSADPALRDRLLEGGRRTAAAHTEAAFTAAVVAVLERTGGRRPDDALPLRGVGRTG